jgi:hypothetical protein
MAAVAGGGTFDAVVDATFELYELRQHVEEVP